MPAVSKSQASQSKYRLQVVSAGLTDVGRKRTRNEDSFLIDDELQLYVVADGMGGHAGGGTASRIAVETLHRELAAAKSLSNGPFGRRAVLAESPLPEIIRSAVEKACTAIYTAAQSDEKLARMGTTVISLLVHHEHALFAHVGDSRAYLLRGDMIQQISEDHSWVAEQVKAGIISPEQARHSSYKNMITRSVGVEAEVQVDVMGILAEPNDTFVLCSDGLATLVEDHEIFDVVRKSRLEDSPKKLIDLANSRGGDDNITVIVAKTRVS